MITIVASILLEKTECSEYSPSDVSTVSRQASLFLQPMLLFPLLGFLPSFSGYVVFADCRLHNCSLVCRFDQLKRRPLRPSLRRGGSFTASEGIRSRNLSGSRLASDSSCQKSRPLLSCNPKMYRSRRL